MIELIENEEINKPKHRYKLSIDSHIISAKVRNFSKDNSTFINIKALNLNATKDISIYKFNDYPNLHFLAMPIRFSESDYYERIFIEKNYLTGQYEINFRYASDLIIWENRKNFLRFYSAYSRFVAELNYSQSAIAKEIGEKNLKPQIKSLSHKNLAYEVSFVVLEFSKNLIDEIQFYSNVLNTYHNETLKILQTIDVFQDSDEELNTVKSIFNFPEDIKFSCEQYILYFATFLKDLGIKATSKLKENAGKVLFSVTPTDDIEALDKIREALAVYLNLPSSPIEYSESFAAIRLHQQIDNLQYSQRMAARELQFNEKLLIAQSEIIQEKNITISQLQSANQQQFKIIEKITSSSIVMDSAENKEEFEKVFDGLEVGESKELIEKLGIKFNPVTSVETLGKKMIGKDEITSLNLNEEMDNKNN